MQNRDVISITVQQIVKNQIDIKKILKGCDILHSTERVFYVE